MKEVVFGPVEATELRVRPNLPVLGPRLGAELGKLRKALDGGRVRGRSPTAASGSRGTTSAADEVLVERTEKEGWAVAASDGATVALDLELDDELRLEGRVYDLIHHVNSLRKEQGLALTDRIDLRLPAADADLLAHADWIARETLALSVEVRRRRRARGAAQPGVRRPRRHQAASTQCRPAATGDRQQDQHQSAVAQQPQHQEDRGRDGQGEAQQDHGEASEGRSAPPAEPRSGSAPDQTSNNGSTSSSSRGPSGDSSVMALRSSAR